MKVQVFLNIGANEPHTELHGLTEGEHDVESDVAELLQATGRGRIIQATPPRPEVAAVPDREPERSPVKAEDKDAKKK